MARARARELHFMVREGRDPLAERQAQKAADDADAAKAQASAMTFGEVANMYIGAHEASWRSAKHRQQWSNSLRNDVLPAIGALPVGSVDTAAVMKILEPLWRTKTETAARVRGRIESILDYAKARSWRSGENPARWRGHLDQLLPARAKAQRVEHLAALPWREMGEFMTRLRCCFSVPSLCLQFLILTAARSGEARGARWSEIDRDHAVWTVPANRIKSGREHRVPLSEPALAVVAEMAQLGTEPGAYVFPGLKGGSALSDISLLRALDAAGGNGATVHGFRSTFRDWAAEATNHPRDICEAALAHALTSKVEAAYQRGDLLEKRRRLMADWAQFCGRPMIAGEVVPLRAASAN
jgi:integrase